MQPTAAAPAAHSGELVRANGELYDKLRKRAEFFRSVSAELRTPLTVLTAAVEQGALPLTPQEAETVTTNAHQLLDLTHELATAGEPEAATGAASVDLAAAAQLIERRYRPLATRRHVRLTVSATTNATAEVQIRPVHVHQVVDNLLSNAFKYSPDGTAVDVRLEFGLGRLRITVSDEGVGISEEDRELIFEPFYRTAETRHVQGTGLGLAAVRRVAERYQGYAQVQPGPAGGSVFVVVLREKQP